jgi:transposase
MEEGSMSFELLAIDLGKPWFHLHGVEPDGVILSKKISRTKLLAAVMELAPANPVGWLH